MKRSLTGIKSTGLPHLGNYLGAIRPALEFARQEEYECFYFIADYHALNAVFDPKVLAQGVYEVAATWMALGLDTQRVAFYRQSEVPEICELAVILNNFAIKGLLNRAHSYKDLTHKNTQEGRDVDHGINMGLYSYPVLMAADILTFAADVVPVGKDQMQHLEMTRDIAQCFNSTYHQEVLRLPTPVVQEGVGLIPGLDGRKMSKSYHNTIPLFGPEKRLKKLINKIKTDSTPPQAPKDPDQSLIFEWYSYFASCEELEELRTRYEQGISWGEAKALLFEKINDELKGPREIYQQLMQDPTPIHQALAQGAQRVRPLAQETLRQVKETVGLLST